jgi:heterodisulfide reductase subunit C2
MAQNPSATPPDEAHSPADPAAASPAARPRPEPLAARVSKAVHLEVARCYQCGKCSAGCPMAVEMPLRPHEVVRLVQLDRQERVLASEAIWLCLGCETCTTRCPNGFDPAMLMDALREIALEDHPDDVPRRLAAFHRSFLDQIRAHGRVFELGLMIAYKLRTGALFDDATTVPGLLRRGKLPMTPRHIDGIDEIRRIFNRCEAEENGK